MKIAALIARILLGFGLLHLWTERFLALHEWPLPSGVAGQFLSALIQSHYDLVVSAVELAEKVACFLLIESVRAVGACTSWACDPLNISSIICSWTSGLIIAIIVIMLWESSPIVTANTWRHICATSLVGNQTAAEPFASQLRKREA